MTKSYKDSGVDIEAGDTLVDWITQDQKPQPHQSRIVDGVGGFASLFRIGFPEIKKPLLVTCTDGVGTKVKLAAQFDQYESVAQDCVAMCVNDLICTGGKPLLFLDYYATGKLDLKSAKAFLTGIKKACHESDCALVGGETAEMPGVYQVGDFDCAGFAVGIVDEEKTLGAHRVRAGDCVIGISSTGFHSNGYSLLRKIFSEDLKEWKDVLLRPTALYVRLMNELQSKVEIHAAAHMTGGGIENIPRVLPQNLKWNSKMWPLPEVFQEVQRRTKMSDQEMRVTLNCGVGFVVIVPQWEVMKTKEVIKKFQFDSFDLGSMEEFK